MDSTAVFDLEGLTTEAVSLKAALQALSAVNQDIMLLDYGNVVIRRGYQNLTTVRFLGGGVSGTDLSQAICVGRGMLTAAILGEETVPSSRQILHTIKELNEGESECNNCGIFVIVQTSTDLFNFGLAVERANADCQNRVRLLPINDDKSVRKERYSCGFILLTKILGAMAEEGALFDEIYQCYADIIDQIMTVPLYYSDAEIGPHSRKSITLSTDFEKEFRHVIDKKSQVNLSLHPSIPTVALINTSRTLERLTELGLVKQVIQRIRQLGVCLIRVYYGSFVTTALRTASLTIMKVFDMKVVNYLDAQTDASGWRTVKQFLPEISLRNEFPGLLQHQGKQPIPLKGPKLIDTQDRIFVKCVQFACNALISCERQLNIMDTERANREGDLGTRLKQMCESVNKRLASNKLPTNCPYAFFKKMGVIAESALGGSMGSVYGMLFEAAATVFGDLPPFEHLSPFVWAEALSVAVTSLSQYCTKEQTEKTMYFPLKCCEAAIRKEMMRDQHYVQCYGFGVSVAEEAVQRTRYPECKHPDPGAHAVGIWLRAVFEGVKLLISPNSCEGLN